MLKAYRTLLPVTFAAGTILALDDRQASARSHLLTEIDDDDCDAVYRAEQPVTFKAGEIIGLAVEPPKGEAGLELVGRLEVPEGLGDEDDTDDGDPEKTGSEMAGEQGKPEGENIGDGSAQEDDGKTDRTEKSENPEKPAKPKAK